MSGFGSLQRDRPRGWQVPDLAEPRRRRSPAALRDAPSIPPPEPVFTAADLDAARAQGEAAGRLQAANEAHALAAAATQRIADALAGASATMAAFAERAAARLAGVIADALAVAFPDFERVLGPSASARIVAAVLPGLADMPRVVVRVSQRVADALQPYVDTVAAAQHDRIQLQPDPACDDGAVRLEWQDGEAVRDSSAIRAAVLAAIRSLAADTGPDVGAS